MRNIIFAACLAVFTTGISAQSFDHESWKLSKKTQMDSVDPSDVKDFPYHYLKYEESDQIFINKKENSYNKFHAVHAKIHINSQKAVDEFKSLYQSGSKEFFQYRIVKANGDVLDKNDEEEDEDETATFDYSNFNINSLALLSFLGGDASISGLDTNCQLEYIYVTKKKYLRNDGDFYGVNFIQSKVPIYNYEYNLITSDNLVFKISGFNGCPEAIEDESDDKNYLTIGMDKVNPFYKSPITATGANKTGFLFTLYKNEFESKTKIRYKYSNYSRSIFEIYMKPDPDKDKLIKSYLKDKTELANKSGLERIQLFELLAKEELEYSYLQTPLSKVVKERRANTTGKLHLFCATLNYWGEKFEIVSVTSRRYIPFDETYDNYAFLDEVLIYLPNYNAYMSPTNSYNFLELIPSVYRERKAVFTKKMGVNDFVSGTHYIETIPPLDPKINFFDRAIDINLSGDKAKASIVSKTGGMQGLVYWNTLKDINYESEEDFFTGLSKVKYADAILVNSSIDAAEKNKTPLNNPVEFSYSFVSDQLITKSGNTMQVNVGGFINEAKGLQESPKAEYPPDIYSGYYKTRIISIQIPTGYKLANMADLNSNKTYGSGDNKEAMVYKMASKVEGNKLIIQVTEKMAMGHFEAKDMDNFLAVYNSGWNLRDLAVEFVKK